MVVVVPHRDGNREIKLMLEGVQSEQIKMFQINYKNYTPSNKNYWKLLEDLHKGRLLRRSASINGFVWHKHTHQK